MSSTSGKNILQNSDAFIEKAQIKASAHVGTSSELPATFFHPYYQFIVYVL